jgi:hypothetical protein
VSDFSEFYRFRKDKFDTHTCQQVKIWFRMPEETKERLREKWRLEDAKIKEKVPKELHGAKRPQEKNDEI